jgi:Flp pilus assembly protein TadG
LGQGLVEFTLILPVLLFMMMGAIDLGRLFSAYVGVENAAREGAFYGAINPACDQPKTGCVDPGTVRWHVTNELSGLTGATVTVTCNGAPVSSACTELSTYKVSVTYPFSLLTPLVSTIVGNTLNLDASATSVVLNAPTGPVATPSLPPASPTIATTLSASAVAIGSAVHDSSVLTGATANASGTVKYTVYTNNTCTAVAQDAGTKSVTSGVVPDSNAITFNSAGTWYWQAVYSGDANNNGATSTCETLTVNKNGPTIATILSASTGAPGAAVHDSSVLTGVTANAGGTVKYTVYTDNTCTLGAIDAGTKSVTSGVVPDSNPITFNNVGTWYWQAVYSGDANNNGATSTCTSETLVIAIPVCSAVPNVIGKSYTQASLDIQAAGLLPFGVEDNGGGNNKGKVTSQSPAAGAVVQCGSQVTYHYNKP